MGCHSFAISNNVTVHVFMDHVAVKAVLGVPNLNGKYTHWWSKVYENGIRYIYIYIYIYIVYLAGKHDSLVDGLSKHPVLLSLSEKLL